MSSMNKKEISGIVIFFIGVLALASSLLHDWVEGKAIQYGSHDRVGILVGTVFVTIGLILSIFEKYKISMKWEVPSTRVNVFEALIVGILIALLAGIGGWVYGYHSSVETGEWSIGIYTTSSQEPFNFTDENVSNPVLTASDVTDVPADFVSDPFLLHENDTYYMFFEVLNTNTGQGDIGLATSNDGLNWTYSQIILDEPFHLSYPCVFKWNDKYYMIPEAHQTNSIRLYKANNFPYNWSFVATLFKGKDFVDPSIFRYDDTWWIFAGTTSNDVLRLFYSDNLEGTWTEHPESPIISGDANIARPGGRVIVFDNRIVRYTQDDDPYYGNQVWAFEITTLTKTSYKEHRVGRRPILKGFDNWNILGMHHIDPYQVGNGWIASVDGIDMRAP